MRTDGIDMAQAVMATREAIENRYGKSICPQPKDVKNKTKNAQEAQMYSPTNASKDAPV